MTTDFTPEAFHNSNWYPASTNDALGLAANQAYCALTASRVAAVGNTIYIDGGILTTQTGSTEGGKVVSDSRPNTRLISIDISKSFSWNNPAVRPADKPSDAPMTSWGALFSVKDKFYAYGGSYTVGSPKSTSSGNAILWSYGRGQGGWKQETSTGNTVTDNWNGGSTSDPKRGVGYYVGGRVTGKSSSGIISANQQSLLALKGNKWTKSDLPSRMAYIQGPYVEYLPLGNKGVLVVLGGRKMERDTAEAEGSILKSMSEIDIYDIDSGKWFMQTASTMGSNELPSSRFHGCSSVFAASDKSSYNIYVYGGLTGNSDYDGTEGDAEVWVLSLPSFIWIKVRAGDTLSVRGHTCVPHGKYMLSITGMQSGSKTPKEQQCRELLQAWDTGVGKWVANSEVILNETTFEVPEVISGQIGGNSKGGATLRAPSSGWGPGLESILTVDTPETLPPDPDDMDITTPTSSDTPTNPAISATPTAPSILSTGALVGIVVGVVLGIVLLGSLLFLLLRRRQRNASSTNTDPTMAHNGQLSYDGPNELQGSTVKSVYEACGTPIASTWSLNGTSTAGSMYMPSPMTPSTEYAEMYGSSVEPVEMWAGRRSGGL